LSIRETSIRNSLSLLRFNHKRRSIYLFDKCRAYINGMLEGTRRHLYQVEFTEAINSQRGKITSKSERN